LLLGGAGLGALFGMRSLDVEQAKVIEDRMDEVKRMLEGQSPAAGPAVRFVPEGSPVVPASSTGG
jgi:hypothetical protein